MDDTSIILLYSDEPHLPLLGIDLLQFNGGKKHLIVMDFQPSTTTSSNNSTSTSDLPRVVKDETDWLLRPIREWYPLL